MRFLYLLKRHFLNTLADNRAFAVVTHGSSLPDSSQKTDFYGIIDNATVTSIVSADISASAAITDSQLATISTAGKVNVSALTGQIANANLAQLTTAALVSGAALTLLPNIPAGAGLIPVANIGSLFGTWVSKTLGTTYQALTDGVVLCTASGVGSNSLQVYTDSNSSPSTLRQAIFTDGSSASGSVITPVKKNDYYQVTGTSMTSVSMYFISLGS